ncbi:phage head closure protein [Paraclostridium sordellii]|uniref:phage head closure protein n=1 Tax=Paraclostridium sordellii TaxID=1505 RepID=UPI0005E027DD|nr:phage head closure protein [Paeniclostridium sordellii]CEP39711.1 Bacteriophage head-tail adaptor [[Clostridium] sordellii] [Paeniclostridium sordellii]
MFNIGELKEVLEIHKEVKLAYKNTGMSTTELQKLYRLRCKKKVQSYKEYINANRETESQIIKFLIFSRRDIYLDNIVFYKNEQYNIKHISPYGNGYVELICEIRR